MIFKTVDGLTYVDATKETVGQLIYHEELNKPLRIHDDTLYQAIAVVVHASGYPAIIFANRGIHFTMSQTILEKMVDAIEARYLGMR